MNSDDEIDADRISAGAGVSHGELLVRFVNASFESEGVLGPVRDECIQTLGWAATVDAAAVIANFHMMTRIADGTGTPLDEGSKEMSTDLREAIGVNGFETKRFDPTVVLDV